jgi:lycopene cyclase domain-containing protein
MEKFTYLLVITAGVLVPFLFSFHPRLRFWNNIRSFIYANLITSSFFILWDVYFTSLKVWGFNDRYVIGTFFKGLPLEEILFFIFIPYACLFSYHCFGIWKGKEFRGFNTHRISILLTFALFILAGFYLDRAYTAVTFILLADFLIFLQFISRPSWLAQFYFTYLIMLIPFFIINGILTGTGLAEPIVWYNSREIINLRILTIPVEDIFYGMLLTGLNIFFYEYFLNKGYSVSSVQNDQSFAEKVRMKDNS